MFLILMTRHKNHSYKILVELHFFYERVPSRKVHFIANKTTRDDIEESEEELEDEEEEKSDKHPGATEQENVDHTIIGAIRSVLDNNVSTIYRISLQLIGKISFL